MLGSHDVGKLGSGAVVKLGSEKNIFHRKGAKGAKEGYAD